MNELPHVIIIGGGFGGLAAARALRKAKVRITLVDARNHHLFQPLLYQVATAGLNPSDIAAPIRGVLRRQKNVRVLLGRVDRVDVPGRQVHLHDEGAVDFDYLVVATGVTHSYFGNDAWAPNAPGLKTVEDALEIRRRVLFAFEAAEHETDDAARAAWMTFAVVGGGPTGVELAGALAELSNHSLAKDFRRISPREARILLFEGGERVLSSFDEKQSAKAQKQLEKLGVTVRTGARVASIDPDQVTLSGGEVIPCQTTLWAAGVAGSPLARSLDAPLDRSGRVLVAPSLTLPDAEHVFVIGDLAALKQEDGSWVPGVAPAAIQGGQHAGRQIRRALKGEPLETFTYNDKGSMATVGRRAAIADLGWIKLSGFLAWCAWLFVHILFLIGFRNRLIVLFQWTWAYWTFQRGARLITGPVAELRDRIDPPEPNDEARSEEEAGLEKNAADAP